jgi:hypothetical protein
MRGHDWGRCVWALDYDGTHLHTGGVFATWAGVAQKVYARFTEL